MALQTITLNGQDVELLDMPALPAPRTIEPWITDQVGKSVSPWTMQTQRQSFPGADQWGLTVTLPPLVAGPGRNAWLAWLMGMRGMRRACQLALPDWSPVADPLTGSTPVADGSDTTKNRAGSLILRTRGWLPNAQWLLAPGETFQLGYRTHWVVLPVDADANGNAAIEVWPSLREQPADGAPLGFANPPATDDGKPRGPLALFSLADNKRSWSNDVTRLTHISFGLQEYR